VGVRGTAAPAEVARPVLIWQRHADKTLYLLHMASGCSHVLSWTEPPEREPMHRISCSACGGTAWVNLWPATAQDADPDEVIEYVERIIGERTAASPPAV